MAFPDKPNVSKTRINRAADIVARGKIRSQIDDKEISEAKKLVDAWRVAHSYPLHVFNANIRKKSKRMTGVIIAQRLKRMPTILDKLGTREKHMDYTNMQDLGGVRAIARNQKDVDKLAKKFLSSKAPHELKDDVNYTINPRPSGYRGRHLIYKFVASSENSKQYNGLMIEVQLRTQLQHIWATSVETMAVVTGQDLKSSRGDKNILKFFKDLSAAFAHIEGTKVPKEYEHLGRRELFKLVVDSSNRLHIRERLSAYLVGIEHMNERKSGRNEYYLLELDTKKRQISITPYQQADKANRVYEAKEAQYINDDSKDLVLVSVKKYNELKKAYPNYFADSRSLLEEIQKMEKQIGKK